MSSDNIIQLAGAMSPTSSAEPSGTDRAPADDETAPAPAAPAVSLQQRRLLAARDINARIAGLEREIARLEQAFAHSQDRVRDGMTQLQQRAVGVMADVLRVSTRLDSQHHRQQEDTRELERRLCEAIARLGRELDQAGSRLQTQEECLRLLQDRHDTLDRLQHHLDKVLGRQGEALGVLTREAHQQFQVTRTHIEGLHALHREQMQAHLALTSDHDLLAIRSAQMEARLAGLHDVVSTSIGHTRRRFRTVAGMMALIAVVTLGLIAWFQLNPTAVPDTVTRQLAGLSASLSEEADRNAVHDATLEAQSSELRDLYAQLENQQIEITRLRTQARQIALEQRDMRLELSGLQEASEDEDAGEAPEAVAADGEAPAALGRIALPPAVPGTRAVF